jgi:hypothetical protein
MTGSSSTVDRVLAALFVLSTDGMVAQLPYGGLVAHGLTTKQKAALARAFGTRVAP